MKRTIIGLVAAAGMLGCATTEYAATGDGVGGSGGVEVAATMGGFHEALAPHGEWVSVGSYGNVWRPNVAEVGAGFRPYATGGHWVYSDVGWNWMSDWDWGWAPFHYGRWILDPAYGWVWVPDTVWGPAWVTWRYGGGFVGWAPLAPVGFVEVESYHPYWCFVNHEHFVDANVYHYANAIDYHQAFAVTGPVTGTVTVNGTTRVWAGPSAASIQQATGHEITPVHIAAPQAGVVAPHSINGVAANQVQHGNIQFGHYSGATAGGGLGTHPAMNNGNPTFNGSHPVTGGPQLGGGVNNMQHPQQMGELNRQPNNPVQPQNPAYRTSPMTNPGSAMNRAPAQSFQQNPGYRAGQTQSPASGAYGSPYGYHAQPAPQYNRAAPMPTYRSAPMPTYRSAPAPAQTYRPASPSPAYRPSSPARPSAPHGGRR